MPASRAQVCVLNRYWDCPFPSVPPQPPHFKKYLLRPEQQRSLGWMLKQEASTEKFVEEEVEEAVLPALGWRAEGRAERAVLVRGGIVADQVRAFRRKKLLRRRLHSPSTSSDPYPFIVVVGVGTSCQRSHT